MSTEAPEGSVDYSAVLAIFPRNGNVLETTLALACDCSGVTEVDAIHRAFTEFAKQLGYTVTRQHAASKPERIDTSIHMLFSLGRVMGTPTCMQALALCGSNGDEYIARHARGDWGIMDDEDCKRNDQAVMNGSRIMSAYMLPDGETKIWIITEADRSVTTLLLPEEY